MKIRGKVIGPACYIIAEVGANHNGSLDLAMSLVAHAARAGANAVKFQLYRAETLFSQHSAPKEWETVHRYEVPYEWLKPLSRYAHDYGMDFICSVFDAETTAEAAKWCDALKVASSDANDLDLIRLVANVGLPHIVSLGVTTYDEKRILINMMASWEVPAGVALACNAVYPSTVAETPLRQLKWAEAVYGLSDHTLSTWLPAVAVGMGAHIIEKHFTLYRDQEGPDHAHSLTPGEFAEMVQNIRDVEAAMALPLDGPTPSEVAANAMWYKRSLHAARYIPKGKAFEREDIIIQRPADGSPPEGLQKMIGKVAERDYQKGEPI